MIHDFKALKNSFPLDFDIELEKDQQVYCFIGENGVGKTKLLESMAKSMLYSHAMFDIYDKPTQPIVNDGAMAGHNKFGKKYGDLCTTPGIGIAIQDLMLPGLALNLTINTREIKNEAITKTGNISFSQISALRKNIYELIDEPVIFISARGRGYIGSANPSGNVQLPRTGPSNFIHIFQNSFDAMCGLDSKSDSVVTNWFLQRLIIDRNLVAGVEQLFASAIYVLKCLEKLANWKLLDENGNPKLSYNENNLELADIPIQYLSTGYASILRIVQEIVSGIEGWNFREVNIDFSETQAIIFIDEIDLHLHPKWQMKIIDILKEFFPKATFYVTTHSPLVLFNLKKGESYRLNKDEKNLVTAKPNTQTNMHFLADIVKEFFDVKDIGVRSVDKDEMLKARKEFQKLLDEDGALDE